MLAVADDDERFLIQFLLATGVREQEAAHMTWDDVKIGSRSVRVTAKPDCRCPSCGVDGFNIKDFEEREIPDLDDWFIDALKARKATAARELLFFNRSGNPEGHILYALKTVPDEMLGDLRHAKIVITNYHSFKLRDRLELSKGGCSS